MVILENSHYIFVGQGIYMSMNVLKEDLTINRSKTFIRLFMTMKDYLSDNRGLLLHRYLETRTTNLEENNKEVRGDLNKIMKNFDYLNICKYFLILDGKKIEVELVYI